MAHILLVDDESSMRLTLTMLLKQANHTLAQAATGAAALEKLENHHFDLVLTDLHLDEVSGLDVLRAAKSTNPQTEVIVLTGYGSVESAVEAMKAGAIDYLTKPIDSEHLVQSVRETMRRDVHLGAVTDGYRPVEVRGFAQLTPREREVLQLITNGQSNKEAGRELGISPRTIEVHRARVMEKLGARNTADLMRIVLTS